MKVQTSRPPSGRQGRERDARDRDEGGAELYLYGSPNDLTASNDK